MASPLAVDLGTTHTRISRREHVLIQRYPSAVAVNSRTGEPIAIGKEALPMLVFDMSIHSAFLFLLALVLSFALASEKTAMYGAVAENLMVILLPGYVITALAALRAFVTKRSPSCLGTLLYFFVIFMIASLSYPVIITTAVVGAIVKIFFFFRKNKKNPA